MEDSFEDEEPPRYSSRRVCVVSSGLTLGEYMNFGADMDFWNVGDIKEGLDLVGSRF